MHHRSARVAHQQIRIGEAVRSQGSAEVGAEIGEGDPPTLISAVRAKSFSGSTIVTVPALPPAMANE